MLELNGTPSLSRRWRWAIAVAAVAVIPMQLVARTPAPQERGGREIYLAELNQETGGVVKLQELDRKVVVAEKSKPSFDLYMLFKTLLFAKESQNAQVADEQAQRKVVAAQSRVVEMQKVDDAKGRVLEMQKRLERAKPQEQRKLVEMMNVEQLKLIEARMQVEVEQTRAAEQRAERVAEMLANVQERVNAERAKAEALRGSEERMKAYLFRTLEEKKLGQETTQSEQLRVLAERYQQLAAEARSLADAIERAQRGMVQPK